MTQLLKRKNIGTAVSALAISLCIGVKLETCFAAPAAKKPEPAAASSVGKTTPETLKTKKELLDLTGGRRVKVVWNQGKEEKDMKLFIFDTKDGIIREVPFAGSAPLITVDGRRVFASLGKAADRAVKMYDTETRKVTELAKGLGNNLLAVWTDPKTKKDWVYVNDSGDKGESWQQPAGKIYRFPVDKPDQREIFWDRTSSHFYLMFSADGKRACLEPSWSNIGQLKLEFDAQGKIDQEKSTYKQFGGGCFPSMAPDNSYRLFRLEGDHRAISMCDADNANPRKIDVTGPLTLAKKSGNTWLTRWSTDPRYMTLVAPAGNEAQIWMGRFDENVTKFETWVRVSPEKGLQCWQSQAWVEPKK